MTKLRRALGALLALVLVAVAATWAGGAWLARAANRPIGPLPASLHGEAVRILTTHDAFVAGWFVAGRRGGGAVLLLHGVRSDRRQMVARARSLSRAGFAVLLVDLPAHGESPGDHVTFGAREGAGVRAALAWLRGRASGERIGVIGVSLGAASFMLSNARPAPDAVVLESMYPTIEDATRDRLALHFGNAAARLAPLLLGQLRWHAGVAPAQLRPIAHLHELHVPLLVAAGALDRHTPVAETRRLFAAANAPKQLWIVPGAAHVDLQAFAPAAYEATVLPFLAGHLQHATAAR